MNTWCWNACSRSSNELKNIVQRKHAVKNPYVVLQSPGDKDEQILCNSRFFRAKCDYVGFDASELTFCKGDIVEVENAYDGRYLYTAKHLQSREIGKISMSHLENEPIIELQPWYFNNITRQEATNILSICTDVGTFLVRKSTNQNQGIQPYSLSIRDEVDGNIAIRHFKIFHDDCGYYISDGCYTKYLDLLIKTYEDDFDGDLGLKPQILTPCHKETRFALAFTELVTNIH